MLDIFTKFPEHLRTNQCTIAPNDRSQANQPFTRSQLAVIGQLIQNQPKAVAGIVCV
jgi:hypothetical protein